MSVEVDHSSSSSLMADVVLDLQQLFEQEMKMMQFEFEEQLRRRGAATVMIGVGVALVFLAAVVGSIGCAHFLSWFTAGVRTAEPLPLWASHAIVATILAIIGGLVTFWGQQMFQPFIVEEVSPSGQLGS